MASLDPENDSSIHRLEGSTGKEKGGLVIMKKGPSGDATKHSFKRPEPRVSLLGLDRLAAAKRKKDEDIDDEPRKSRVTSYRDEDDEVEEDTYSKKDRSHTKER